MTGKSWIGCTVNWNNTTPEEEKWWIVRGTDQNELARLPYSMGEHGVMGIVHTVRDLEKAQYAAGKEFGEQAMLAAGRQKLREQDAVIQALKHENERLANKLESLIGAKD